MTQSNLKPMEIRIAHVPDCPEALMRGDESTFLANMAVVASAGAGQKKPLIDSIIRDALYIANNSGRAIKVNTCNELLNSHVLVDIGKCGMGTTYLSRLRSAIASFVAATRDQQQLTWLPCHEPSLDLQKQKIVVRYGNVELRVVENFMLDTDRLSSVIRNLVASGLDENRMYAKLNSNTFLSADDIEGNIRALMTNAGFYVQNNPNQAEFVLHDWSRRYLAALSNPLASYPAAYPFYFTIQRLRWEETGTRPSYIRHPSPFELYRNLQNEEVFFLSPLAEMVNAQVKSGRIKHLYKDFAMPEFGLHAHPAWISTWPNRPHQDWSETFGELCKIVDSAYRERQFTVFIASCGCYGLPICDYAHKTYGCKAIYLGNITNAYFGVLQNATRNLLSKRANPDMWIDGNLRGIPMLDRIDGGRYV